MERIVLFDGVCQFCNGAVNFIIARDVHKRFKFAPLQSEAGETLRAEHSIGHDIDSIVLIEDGRSYLHSDAALRIARGLGGWMSALYVFIVVPDFIRDWFYKLFASYRYKLFGKTDACMMPTPEVRERFLT